MFFAGSGLFNRQSVKKAIFGPKRTSKGQGYKTSILRNFPEDFDLVMSVFSVAESVGRYHVLEDI